MSEKVIKFKVINQFINKTIYEYLLSFHLSNSFINDLFNNKKIKVNNEIVNKEYILICTDIIAIILSLVNKIIPYNFPIDIIYEDDFIIVVNKPQNILVHTDGNTNSTLTNAVNNYLSLADANPCAYPIHRLDYETTGIVIFAKNKLSLSFLSVEIENHLLYKQYVCLCYGKFKELEGEINKPIGKNRHNNNQIVCKNGKTATSYYKVIKNDKISKVLVNIEHGRKHQIRVHMNYIGHSIVGDKIYGNDLGGLKLHFKKVIFTHPYTREKMTIECKEAF